MFSEIGRTYIAGFLSPTSILGLILLSGLFFLWKNKIQSARLILTIGISGFVLMTMSPIKNLAFNLLESEPSTIPADVKYVVVLGGKIYPRADHPLSSQITPSLLSRLTHAVSFVKAHPGTILVLTGNGAGEKTEAELMERFSLEMGLGKERIILEKEAMNTEDHPLYLKSILTGNKFAIVTSAYHMPRALRIFEAQGLHGYPYPTDYQNKTGLSAASLIMRGENLSALDRAFTEFYSSLWNFIKSIF